MAVFIPITRYVDKVASARDAGLFGERRGHGARRVYGICGRDGLCVYIGVTTQPLAKRMAWHRRNPTNARMATWLDGNPNAYIYQLCWASKYQWEACERYLIRFGRSAGRLLNRHPGGAITWQEPIPTETDTGPVMVGSRADWAANAIDTGRANIRRKRGPKYTLPAAPPVQPLKPGASPKPTSGRRRRYVT